MNYNSNVIPISTPKKRERKEITVADLIRTYDGVVYFPSDKERKNPVPAKIKVYSPGSLPGGPVPYEGDELQRRVWEFEEWEKRNYQPQYELYTEELIVPGGRAARDYGFNHIKKKKTGTDEVDVEINGGAA